MADMYLGNESGGFDLVGTTNIKNIDFEEAKISKEDYENLSEEEQKTGVHLVTGLEGTDDDGRSADLISYDNTNSGLGSTNVQGAIDELNSNLGKIALLWENPNPTSSFASQDIEIADISAYAFLMIVYSMSNTNLRCDSVIVSTDQYGAQLPVNGGSAYGVRTCNFTSNTTLEFGSGNYNGSTDNKYGIPRKIYGFTI